MATKTANISLIKPAHNEYFNQWHEPVNKNADIIDSEIGALKDEVTAARGSEVDLATRLNNGLNADGTLKATDEVVSARSSKVYNSDDGTTDYDLDARIEQGDLEAWYARQGNDGLIDALAWVEDGNVENSVVSAATNYITYSGAVVTVNGAATTVVANINGYRQAVRTNKTVTISGAAGTYYLYLQRQSTGETYLTGTTGTTAAYVPNAKLQKFSATAVNFVTAGVKPGDILEITAPGGNLNLGKYVVHSTNAEDAVNLATNEVRIIGEFNSISTGLSFSFINPIAPTFGFTATAHSKLFSKSSGKIYIGRCVFDGANVTSVTQYALKGVYNAFTQVTGNFSLTIAHNLGFIPRRLLVYASQANDFTQPMEILSVAEVSGGGALQRSVVAQFTDTTLSIKNATTGVFYKDFGGTTQTAGYLYIVAER
jgi:hypothetical protein